MNVELTNQGASWTDARGNSWSTHRFSEEEANEYSGRMTGSRHCSNCRDCVDCHDCFDCENCSNCFNCYGCFDCLDCLDCSNCVECVDCRSCKFLNASNDVYNIEKDPITDVRVFSDMHVIPGGTALSRA